MALLLTMQIFSDSPDQQTALFYDTICGYLQNIDFMKIKEGKKRFHCETLKLRKNSLV